MTRYGNTFKSKALDGGASVHFGPMSVQEDGDYVRYADVLPVLNDNVFLKAAVEEKDKTIRAQAEEISMLRGMLSFAKSTQSDDYDRLVRMKANENFTSK